MARRWWACRRTGTRETRGRGQRWRLVPLARSPRRDTRPLLGFAGPEDRVAALDVLVRFDDDPAVALALQEVAILHGLPRVAQVRAAHLIESGQPALEGDCPDTAGPQLLDPLEVHDLELRVQVLPHRAHTRD